MTRKDVQYLFDKIDPENTNALIIVAQVETSASEGTEVISSPMTLEQELGNLEVAKHTLLNAILHAPERLE